MKSRREFLQIGALSLGAATLGFASSTAITNGSTVGLIRGKDLRITDAENVSWALDHLAQKLELRGFKVRRVQSIEELAPKEFCIVASGKLSVRNDSYGFYTISPETLAGRPVLTAFGSDSLSVMYALLEIADRVEHADDPAAALAFDKPFSERARNQYRGICRPFVSDVEDKPWFNDRAMWPDYFAMLATQRINRFHLALGLGYDFLKGVTDSYLLFAYPFLLEVPGYNVRAVNLRDAERDQNLANLQYISRQAVLHGIDFQLGLWTHGYQFADSPNVNYTISGLNSDNHAAYCRDALALLLQQCPDISGVTLRTHYESGVKEGNYGFWKTVFDGVPKSGRRVQIDLHVKGLDQQMLANATATGMNIMLSPKYWAEHMGLPYQQTAIRDLEMPKADVTGKDYSTLSEGSRIFTRYGYADFLTEDRDYSVMYRVFPGTHRFLLWGDPVSMAAHSRAFQFCGSNGAELFEPLSFKGRRGSGLLGNRCAYNDPSLNPAHDWEKFLYTYRVWGRLLYNPDADPDICRRPLRHKFPTCAPQVESALGAATRILPLVTTAHLPSAAHDAYWPEIYTNQSLFDPKAPSPYGDTPAPKTFVNVSPLDPEIFSRISDSVADLLNGKNTGQCSPIEVAQLLEELCVNAINALAGAERGATDKANPDFRRFAIDVRIQISLGRFFATKLRAGTLYAIYQQSKDRSALEQSVNLYKQARELWSMLAKESSGAYVADITYGPLPHQRGHWSDRLVAMDTDVAGLAQQLAAAPAGPPPDDKVKAAIQLAFNRPNRFVPNCTHVPTTTFIPGNLLAIDLIANDAELTAVRFHYRHVDQAEHYEVTDMQRDKNTFRATIPAAYTNSKYALQYYFELHRGTDAVIYPVFNANMTNTPYFVVRTKK
jgi:hypothetical protein